MSTLITIKLSSGDLQYDEINKEHKYFTYAGRALSSKIVYDSVPADCDPLEEQNKLIFSCGFLSGTPAPNSGRMSIGGKSPLTGGIKEANCGGRSPALIARQGIRGIILEGRAESLKIIKIEDGKADIIDGTPYKGLGTYELADKLKNKYGKRIGVLSIGPVGEDQGKSASIQSTDLEGYPSRAAARGGLGGLMGSKKVKAVVVCPTTKSKQIEYHDFDAFKDLTKEWFMELYKTKRTFSEYGTAITVNIVNAVNGLPTKNFRKGSFKDFEKINGDALHEFIDKNKGKYSVGCSPGCAIRCSNIVNDKQGNHITSSLEYETIALNGSNLLINDIETLAKIDHQCDDIGIDTIEAGNTLAVLMEAGEIEWGDGKAVVEFLKGYKEGDEKSQLLNKGAHRLAKYLDVERDPTVKKQGLPGYDPRTFKGMGVTFVTSPMGADHTAGPAIKGRKAYDDQEYGKLNEAKGKVRLSKQLQIFVMLVDSCGLCYFVGPSWENTKLLSKILNAMYNWDKSAEDLVDMAKGWLELEKEYNKQAGIPETFKLPAFLTNKIEEGSGNKWDLDSDRIKAFWNL